MIWWSHIQAKNNFFVEDGILYQANKAIKKPVISLLDEVLHSAL